MCLLDRVGVSVRLHVWKLRCSLLLIGAALENFPFEKKLVSGSCGKKTETFQPPSFADFVNQPFVLNRPLGYNYHSIAKPCLLCWLHSNMGVDDEIMAS